jgi:hypothetical protein
MVQHYRRVAARSAAGNRAELLRCLPHDMVTNRVVRRMATQISFSADGKYAFLDGYTPRFRSPLNFNHARFPPTDSDLMLLSRMLM